MLQRASNLLLLLGLVLTWVLGTETRLLFFWPAVAVLGLAGVLAMLRGRLRVYFPPSEVCLLSVLVLAGYLFTRAAFSPVPNYALEDQVMLLACVLIYLLTAVCASHPRWRTAMLGVLLAVAAGNLAMGSVHLSGEWGFHVVPHFLRPSEPGRIGGFFANANHLAAFLSVVLFLAAGWLCVGRAGSALRLWLGFLCVAVTMGMSLTVSRGAFIGLLVGGLVFSVAVLWLVWQTRRHLFWSLLAGGVVMALLAGIVLWRVNEQYLRERTERLSVTGDVRLGIWESALAQHAEQPWLGAGARMFYEGGTRLRSPRLPAWTPEPLFAHNEYLQTLADYGWVGLGLLGLVALLHAANGVRFLRWFVQEKFIHTGQVLSMNLALCLGALSALAATMAHAFFEFHGHVPATALSIALVMGLLANPGYEEMARPLRRVPFARPLAKGGLVLASLALLAAVWLHGRGDWALAQAQLAQARGDEAARRQHLDEAARLSPGQAEVFYQRGLAALEQLTEKDRSPPSAALQGAVQDLEKATQLNGRNFLSHLALADAYDAIGRTDDALRSIQVALALAPHHEEPRLALGIHWHRLADWPQAERAYLWAREAWARNDQKQAGWLESYRLLLQHVALIRRQAASP